MGERFLKVILIATATALIGCAEEPGTVAYNSDNSGGILHQISTDPSEIFRNKVDHEAALEARGVEPPVGSATWRDFWAKMIAYWSSSDTGVGSQHDVAAYIGQQRRIHRLAPL
jgi:hypothetical protein